MIYRDQRFRDQPTMFDGPVFVPDQVPVVTTSTGTRSYADQGIVSRNETYVETLPNHNKQAGLVLAAIASSGLDGMTREELAAKLRLSIGSICGRVRELKETGVVIDTERRRPTSNGKSAAVIVCQEFLSDEEKDSFVSNSPSKAVSATSFLSECVMPDQVTCPYVPVDDLGDQISAGRIYLVNNRPVLCYEADGDMFLQHCSLSGQPLVDAEPQSVGLLPPDVVIHRVVSS